MPDESEELVGGARLHTLAAHEIERVTKQLARQEKAAREKARAAKIAADYAREAKKKVGKKPKGRAKKLA